jgi:uncharacterized membrane protein
MPKPVDPLGAKLRFQMAAGCTALALVAGFIAYRFQTEPYLKAEQVRSSPNEKYPYVWLSSQDALVGATLEGARLTIRRWARGADPEQAWEVRLTGAGENPDRRLWTTDGNLEYAAWIGGGELHIQALAPGGRHIAAALGERRALALTSMSGGAVAVVFADAAVARWNADTGMLLDETRLPVGAADRAFATGDYVAVASENERKAVLFGYRQGWNLAETAYWPQSASDVLIPAPGALAVRVGGAVRLGGAARNTPGAVRSFLLFRGYVAATGDFNGVLVLPDGEEPYLVAEAAPGSAAAAGRDALAVSGARGTSLYRLSVDERLTVAGRSLAVLSTSLFGLSAALLVLPVLLARIVGLFRLFLLGKLLPASRKPAPEKLGSPPPQLIEACASGRVVLWAGAGVSAQAGLPDRRTFVANLLQAAAVEGWLDAIRAQALLRRMQREDSEAAMEQLLEIAPPAQLIAYLEGAVPRYTPASRAHQLLARIPFQAMLTTNYDGTLERLENPCARNPLTLSHPGLGLMNTPFLLKLYGHLAQPESLLLARGPMSEAARGNGFNLAPLMTTRTFLFAGCSLDCLLRDLRALQAPPAGAREHFAVAAADGAWRESLRELRERYGVHAQVCRDDRISAELPAFFEALARGTGVLMETRPAPPQVPA